MSLHQINRLSTAVDGLASVYSKVSEEIDSLKTTKKHVKAEVKKYRDELDAMKGRCNTSQAVVRRVSERKLEKADKRTAIQKLELQLARVEQRMVGLEEEQRRVFGKRERMKAKMVKKMVDEVHEGVTVARVEEVGAVGKMVEWVGVEPRFCRVSSTMSEEAQVKVGEEARRLNLKMEFQDEEEGDGTSARHN